MDDHMDPMDFDGTYHPRYVDHSGSVWINVWRNLISGSRIIGILRSTFWLQFCEDSALLHSRNHGGAHAACN